MEQYICIHGHFYQPPRDNPWLEAIELQDSAYPYHDWNERITAECYAPNTAARILGKKGLIARIVNNYARTSFNFGPTLLDWLDKNIPETYQAIVEADRARPAELAIKEVNSGAYIFSVKALAAAVKKLKKKGSKGEYYLTDIVASAVAEGFPVAVSHPQSPVECLGVNSRRELARIERHLQMDNAQALLDAGVTLADPARRPARRPLAAGRLGLRGRRR